MESQARNDNEIIKMLSQQKGNCAGELINYKQIDLSAVIVVLYNIYV